MCNDEVWGWFIISQRCNVPTLQQAYVQSSKEKSMKRIPFIFFSRKYELRYYNDDAMKHLAYSCFMTRGHISLSNYSFQVLFLSFYKRWVWPFRNIYKSTRKIIIIRYKNIFKTEIHQNQFYIHLSLFRNFLQGTNRELGTSVRSNIHNFSIDCSFQRPWMGHERVYSIE